MGLKTWLSRDPTKRGADAAALQPPSPVPAPHQPHQSQSQMQPPIPPAKPVRSLNLTLSFPSADPPLDLEAIRDGCETLMCDPELHGSAWRRRESDAIDGDRCSPGAAVVPMLRSEPLGNDESFVQAAGEPRQQQLLESRPQPHMQRRGARGQSLPGAIEAARRSQHESSGTDSWHEEGKACDALQADPLDEEERPSLLGALRDSLLGRRKAGSRASLRDADSFARLSDAPEMSADDTIVMTGWLEKCGQQFKTWNWRYFVLRSDGILAYYTDDKMKKFKGCLRVDHEVQAEISVQANTIEKKNVFMIATPKRNLVASAPTQKEMTEWIAKLYSAGVRPSQPWDPMRKTVKYFVFDRECPHEWKRFDDPTSYIHMEGCLMKRGHVNKNWKNRFFRIEQGELRYYSENKVQLKGSMPLKGTIVSPGMAQCPDGRKNYFVVTSRDGQLELHLNAADEGTMHRWIEALQEAQTALSTWGTKETVSGLALVVKRGEEVPLAKVDVVYGTRDDINVTLERRTEALIVSSCPHKTIPLGCQLIAVNGRMILHNKFAAAAQALKDATFPLRLSFLFPPFKKGSLVKKSRSGFENWKKRMVIVTSGEIRYFQEVTSSKGSTLRHRKSFSLVGCYLNLVKLPGRDFCIVVARSPTDKLVLQTPSEEERMEWASVIYCSIRMMSQGITAGHIEKLNLNSSRACAARGTPSDLQGSFARNIHIPF